MAQNYAIKYQPKVAERFKKASITNAGAGHAYNFVGAQTIAIYSVDTVPLVDFNRTAVSYNEFYISIKEKYEKLIAEGITPISRMGKPEDIGKCVASIAQGNFDFCTGTVIDCDGGFNVRCL